MLSYGHIKKYAAEAGFSLCGVARARALTEHSERFAAALAVSGEGALGYLVRDPARRLDPSRLLAGVRTVVVCALEYDPRAVETDRGKVSAHRRGGDYQPRIKAMLSTVLERLQAENPGLRGKVCCDTSAILEKAWAVEAGLGWIGRHSLLVNPTLGSFLLLGEILLDEESDLCDEPCSGPGCGACRRCVEACPVGALVAEGGGVAAVNTSRCISALTIEPSARKAGASSPTERRPSPKAEEASCEGGSIRLRKGLEAEPLHGWIYGCDDCQNACPYNKPELGMRWAYPEPGLTNRRTAGRVTPAGCRILAKR